jgi:hypothetical protein
MDKIKQNIDLQEAIQRYNIEKSVVGTLAYNIEQNIQKGMSPDEAIENVLQKSKPANIGDIHTWNGKRFKKQPNGKWMEVSESHNFTKKDHLMTSMFYTNKGSSEQKEHEEASSKLSDKEYSDEEVTGGEKKEEAFDHTFFDDYKLSSQERQLVSDVKSGKKPFNELTNLHDNSSNIDQKARNYLQKFMNKSFSSTLSKSEQTEAQKAKVKKVVEEFNKGILKSSTGELITDRSEALRFALSEAGIEIEKSGGEGSRGGKVIGHTKSGKPIYDTFEHEGHKSFDKYDHSDAVKLHMKLMSKNDNKRGYQDLNNKKDKTYINHEELAVKHSEAQRN